MTFHAIIAASIIEPVPLCSELGALGPTVLAAIEHTVVGLSGVSGGSFGPLALGIVHFRAHVTAIPMTWADKQECSRLFWLLLRSCPLIRSFQSYYAHKQYHSVS